MAGLQERRRHSGGDGGGGGAAPRDSTPPYRCENNVPCPVQDTKDRQGPIVKPAADTTIASPADRYVGRRTR